MAPAAAQLRLGDAGENLQFYRHEYYRARRFSPDIVRHYQAHLRRLLPRLALAPGQRALDAGCGMGYLEIALEGRIADLVSVDIAQSAVAELRGRLPGVRAGVADIAHLPFGDGAFDLVFSFEVVEHVADAQAAGRELVRVLRPGGRLVLLQHYRNDDYRHLLRRGGDCLRALGLRSRAAVAPETREVHIGARPPAGWIAFLRELGLAVEDVIILSVLPPLYWLPGLHARFYDLPLLTPLDHALCRLGPLARFLAMGSLYIARRPIHQEG